MWWMWYEDVMDMIWRCNGQDMKMLWIWYKDGNGYDDVMDKIWRCNG